MKTTLLFLILAVALLSSGLTATAQPQRKPDATTILNNVRAKYSRLTSYQDEGILVTTHDEPTGGLIEKMPFKTYFKRPKLFRFEWTYYGISKLGQTKMIWFDGKEAFSYWEPDRYEKEKSFSMAVAGASGITYGAVHTVTDLLLPDEFSASILNRLTNISLAGEESFEEIPCFRIEATDRDERIELWVGKADFLLRKIKRERKAGDDSWINEETRRKIQVDQSIPEIVFNYKPSIPLTTAKYVDSKELDALVNPVPPVWTEFRSEEGRFTVWLPGKPVTQTASVDTPQGRFEHHVFAASHGSLVCSVAYTDLPKTILAGNNVDAIFDGIRDQFIKEVGGKLASESPLTLDGHSGREIKVLMFSGELRLRFILVGDRVYMLSLLQMEKTPESGDEIPNKFFPSFKFNPITKPVAVLRVKQ